ncbi:MULTISPECIES: FxLYD domain-containing protein [Bacillaceae]|uniref:FxLYD domain-containing protein n=1 Tax=Evansella alkalicola TaxID=745819 RepID=A0ABS6JSM4_9BACI|nr:MULTISPECIES: FxLYD domain-containing protein [Bacillaceae]MBU9721573.1 FxLYD domain-containing protein [Bacillus alkalicola]
MYCYQCGKNLPEESQFCSYCGTDEISKVTNDSNDDDNFHTPADVSTNHIDATIEHESTVPSSEQNIQQEYKRTRPRKKGSFIFSILLPIITFFALLGGLFYYFLHETSINEKVIELQLSAEEAAWSGDYEAAIDDLVEAKALRPTYVVLDDNLQIIQRAETLSNELAEIKNHIEAGELIEAEQSLNLFNEELSKESSLLFTKFHEEALQQQRLITVGKIELELNELTTVNELSDRLSIIRSTPTEKSDEVITRILDKIVQISLDNAVTSLERNQFSEAITTINQGLVLAMDNEELLSLKDSILDQQSSFEQAEQQRIEAAMEAAAQEDMRNRTNAVDVIVFDTEMDENGDIYIHGELKNIATVEISSVEVNYSIYDEAGNKIGSSFAAVSPDYLSPEQSGMFEDYYFLNEIYERVTVQIESIAWNLY